MKKYPAPIASAFVAALTVIGLNLPVHAAIIAHWRFEASPGFLNDSAGSNTLTNNGSVTQVASPFSDPVPQTGAANAHAASFNGTNYLTAADNAAFTSQTFSLEAFFTTGDVSKTRVIAGHFGSGAPYANQRSYAIGMMDSKLMLFVGTSTGNGTRNFELGVLNNNVNYYAAATVDFGGSGDITLYLQDLTNSGPLQTANFLKTDGVGGVLGANLFNSSAPFSIGSNAQGGSLFDGIIDEVRFSNTKLGASELRISIPEPSTLVLLGPALGSAVLFGRRSRRN